MREASSVAELWFARSLPKRSPSFVFVRKGSFIFLREHLGNRQEQQKRKCMSDTRNQITAHHRKISTKSINCFKTYKFVWLKEKRGNSTKLRNLFSHWKYDFLVSGFLFHQPLSLMEIVSTNCGDWFCCFRNCFTKKVFSVLSQSCDIVFVSRTDLSKSPCCGTTKSLCYQS